MPGILIVDDHAGFRTQARMLLEASGYVVVGEAADAASAVEAVNELDPDVILLDVQLPDHDGFWVTEHLPEDKRPRVVMISTREAADYGSRLAGKPFVSFIHKPELSRSRLEEALGTAA